jgi:hypothetical protein
MRRLTLLCTLLALPAFADEKPKPNTLTPKEIADGWILLFDGETTYGWKVEGEVKVKDGILILGGEKATRATITTPFTQGTVKYQFGDGSAWTSATYTRNEKGGAIGLGTGTLGKNLGGAVEGKFNSEGFAIEIRPGFRIQFKDIQFNPGSPSEMTSLFNAKDLTGWKEFQSTKDKKVASKFTVTKEGWLNVKNGPGDLQTEGQWADFVLQFDCISNGKHCNSGMFFRCIPDLYQQGYEAQIRNEWMGEDRTKPVDFGTGAIYRRQAARKVVSTDGEWFTMTVAAHGRHLATWVNGYQVTDWTDDRKENDNARNGFKKGKGALSIQGHDPTTDLSFRSIRIQSLDPK